ncbi:MULTISPECIES: DUF2510 domain-containing protein [unclassified Mycobacterium]|uniref:DUF2510 domain-containing protein n=1 Tax=unclassified Mycobacterium TaxID=2642494 RepID=UPI0007FFD4CB|nr:MULTISPECIES: DUF2510 domain-containing protein [unclassified Mycobacterium]OBG50481.1 hypothetical protein A5704_05720 [Mycobacterium sp. E735]OBG57671.1 hypothetical protein A5703_04305 [Mycobacterium sp. E188]OBG78155.1 hypothetical protein A5701_01195 [Mycobacterium sp. E3305]OBH46783.1 hypothetical protein A5691_13750 [Mycobacterium sp. E183]
MIAGAVNSLVWILVLIAIVAVIIAVVRAVSAPRAERPVVERPVVQQQPVATSGLAPGWYPDQQDMQMMRYFDGRVWTAQTQPRA